MIQVIPVVDNRGPVLPLGGSAGDVLVKASESDGDAEWQTLEAAGIATKEDVAELFQFASDGKAAVAGAIGEPAMEEDTFAELAGYLLDGRGALALRLTEKGVDAAQSEALLTLIDKIADIPVLEGETVVNAETGDLWRLTERITLFRTLFPYGHDAMKLCGAAAASAAAGIQAFQGEQVSVSESLIAFAKRSPYALGEMTLTDAPAAFTVTGGMRAIANEWARLRDGARAFIALSPYARDTVTLSDCAGVFAVTGGPTAEVGDLMTLTGAAAPQATMD
jgi:hypothetical protein